MEENKVMIHESYGVLGFARCQTTGTALFGSSIKHRNVMKLELREAECQRSLNNNSYFGRKKLFEIEMSMSQFAQLISMPNCGEGVPVTIREIEGRRLERCPYIRETKAYKDEINEVYKNVSKKATTLIDDLTTKFNGTKPLNKKEKEEILSLLTQFRNEINGNEKYRNDEFKKHIEKVTFDAKVEIETFFDNKLAQLGKSKLLEGKIENPVGLIEDNKDE